MSLSNKKSALRKWIPDLSIKPTETVWEPPTEDECDPEEITQTPLDAITRVVQRFRYYEKRLVDYAIILEKLHDGEWVEVSKIDCCHAQVHLHQRFGDEDTDDSRVVLREVKDETDIQKSVSDAIDHIFDNYEEHLRRWSNGR